MFSYEDFKFSCLVTLKSPCNFEKFVFFPNKIDLQIFSMYSTIFSFGFSCTELPFYYLLWNDSKMLRFHKPIWNIYVLPCADFVNRQTDRKILSSSFNRSEIFNTNVFLMTIKYLIPNRTLLPPLPPNYDIEKTTRLLWYQLKSFREYSSD